MYCGPLKSEYALQGLAQSVLKIFKRPLAETFHRRWETLDNFLKNLSCILCLQSINHWKTCGMSYL
jgi:hypothetical protein